MISGFTVILPPLLSEEERSQAALKLCGGSLTEGDGDGDGDDYGDGYGYGCGCGYGWGSGGGASGVA